MCPLAKTIGIMKCSVGFHEAALKAMAEFSGERKVRWNYINSHTKDYLYKLTQMKFEMPRQADDVYKQKLNVGLYDEIMAAFRTMAEER